MTNKLLGQSLIEAGLLTEEQLAEALKIQRKTGHGLGYTLVKCNILTQKQLISFLESKLGIPYANLDNYVVDKSVLKLVPESLAERYLLIPLVKVKNTLTVAMVDPLDSFIVDSLKQTTNCEIKPLISTEDEIKKAIKKFYHPDFSAEIEVKKDGLSELKKITTKWTSDFKGDPVTFSDIDASKGKKAPIVELVDLIISKAAAYGASDIHLEPDETVFRIRYRIDGILQEVMSLSKQLESAVISRIKIMANLDIAEKRVPQDGRVKFQLPDRNIDLRVSTFPTVLGEKGVIRLLERSSILIDLDKLGFEPDVHYKFNNAIMKPNGIILVTGPTGSGKSTTLYAALDKINSMDKNIVTIEDPVEYRMPVINQSQINPKAGYDFANGLRSILRQDPDIIMVGEIRDYETAEIAIRAALTGHLVLSTLHTNDACGAFIRLVDMGVEPFLVASSVICVMAQRLVRIICENCKVNYIPERYLIEKLKGSLINIPEELRGAKIKFYKGEGCEACKKFGYKGRTCINEIVIPNEEIKSYIVNKAPTSTIKKLAREKYGMRTLREDGILKVLKGITTIDEVVRVAYADEVG